jgi:hypothetical protein
MAEVREVATHKLTDDEVRKRFARALEQYRKEYPGYTIETTWKSPTVCQVNLRMSPMLVLKGTVTLVPGQLLFVVAYPDVFRGFSSDIAEYVQAFRDEVKKHLGSG